LRLNSPHSRLAVQHGPIPLSTHGATLLLSDSACERRFLSGVGWGICGLGVGGGQATIGRVGPEKQQFCCGCSCLVLLLVLPALGGLLYSHGGPVMAADAVPLWIPAAHATDLGWRLGAVWATGLTQTVRGLMPGG
jgi:hypothetical protein